MNNKPTAQRYSRRADLVTDNGHPRRPSSGPAREAWTYAGCRVRPRRY
jgi:hypothetical protein